ncbi:MAG TPA: hypothetical protein VEX86_04545 [Longimicrobium sp.]|nr:hypothetical protein [Longimicrobium sp.]
MACALAETRKPPLANLVGAPARPVVRRCACGGVVGPGGECAACREKRLAREAPGGVAGHGAAAPAARAGFDFGRVALHAPGRAARGVPPAGSRHSVLSAPLATAETGLDQPQDTMVDGVLATAMLPCYGTGGLSVCNPGTGNYDITGNSNNCCTRACTQRHEERHVSDLQDCCAALHTRIAAGGDRNALIGQYNTWMNSGVKAWTECNAYGVSITCAEALRTSNGCGAADAGAPSQCCTEIDDYLSNARSQRTSNCAAAPATRPACPF